MGGTEKKRKCIIPVHFVIHYCSTVEEKIFLAGMFCWQETRMQMICQ
jgi:hypothetical protein